MTEPGQRETVPVLIVGGGPVGLTLFTDLHLRDVPCVLVTSSETTSEHPKCNSISARSMEHFRRLGIKEKLRHGGLPDDHPTDIVYLTRHCGIELARHRMPAINGRSEEHSWPLLETARRLSQIYLEKAMVDRARELGGDHLCFGVELISYRCVNDGVIATIRNRATGEVSEIACDYLVGCDGSRSVVRVQANIELERLGGEALDMFGGRMLSMYFRSPELARRLPEEPAFMYWALNSERRGLLISIDGCDRFLCHIQLQPGEEADSALMHALLGVVFGDTSIAVEFLSTQVWNAGSWAVARNYREGSVFLCGDAAHLFTPTGGFGMNTGIDDAANLAWKLEAVLKKHADPALLDTYELERRAGALRSINASRAIAKRIASLAPDASLEANSEEGKAARTRLGKAALEVAQHEFITEGVQLGLSHAGSPVVQETEAVDPMADCGEYRPVSSPGSQAPHIRNTRGEVLMDQARGNWVLAGHNENRARALLKVATEQGLAVEWFLLQRGEYPEGLYCDELYLVRPDNHIAWCGNDVDAASASEIMDLVLAHQFAGSSPLRVDAS